MPTGVYQRKPMSDETKRRIGEANKIALLGHTPWNKGKKAPQISAAKMGHTVSEETRAKISVSKRKNPTRYWLGKARPSISGDKNWRWGGDNISYRGIHKWVYKVLGQPSVCELCEKNGSGHSMHWANISGNYLREVTDWIRLCARCHKQFDIGKIII